MIGIVGGVGPYTGILCNTAHSQSIFDVIEEELKNSSSKLKLLNMISETVAFIRSNYSNISRIGVLSTTGTYNSGVYKKTLEANGYEVIVPTTEIQKKYIHTAIYDSDYGIKSFLILFEINIKFFFPNFNSYI